MGSRSNNRANFTAKTRAAVIERAKGICELEGCDEPANEVDHIIECWEGGTNAIENAQLLCRKHHQEKTSHSTHLRGKGKRFAIQKGRPKSGKVKSRGFGKTKRKIPSRKFGKPIDKRL